MTLTQSPRTHAERLNAMYQFEAYRSVDDPTDIEHLQTELQYAFGTTVQPIDVAGRALQLFSKRASIRIVHAALTSNFHERDLTARGVVERIRERVDTYRAHPVTISVDLFSVQEAEDGSHVLSLKSRDPQDGTAIATDREEIVKGAFDNNWPRPLTDLEPFDFDFPIAHIHDTQIAEEIGFSRPMRAYDIPLGQLAIAR